MTVQEATFEELKLLQNNDVPVDVTLIINDPTGNPVPNWDDVTVELIAEGAGMLLLLSSAAATTGGGPDPLITKLPQALPADDTVIVVQFPRGFLASPLSGTYVVDVIDPTTPSGVNANSRLTYRWGPFIIQRTRADGVLTGWVTTSIQAAIDAAVAVLAVRVTALEAVTISDGGDANDWS